MKQIKLEKGKLKIIEEKEIPLSSETRDLALLKQRLEEELQGIISQMQTLDKRRVELIEAIRAIS